MMMRRVVEGLDDRLAAASFARRALRKAFPDHWAFMLGEIAMYCFIILVLTGTFLTFFYVASTEKVIYHGPYAPLRGHVMSAAYASVLRISYEVRAGLVMRQIHHWTAVVFIAAISAHILRVFFTGAFRRPRKINWLIGLTLLLAGIGAGFTGYSLPDDLLSGTGVRIAYSVLLSIPVVRTWAAFLVFGEEFPRSDFIGRRDDVGVRYRWDDRRHLGRHPRGHERNAADDDQPSHQRRGPGCESDQYPCHS